MPLRNIGPYKVIESDDSYLTRYWPLLSKQIKDRYGDKEITEGVKVQEILKECFSFFCNEFKTLLAHKNKASFFIFVQDIHEDSIEIWHQRLKGNRIPVDDEDFAATRRILKCTLEQGCALDLVGHPNFYKEIMANTAEYIKHLEELLYLGLRAFELTETIARSLLCPHSIGIHVIDDELNIITYQPFDTLFGFIFEDHKRHNNTVVLSDCVIEFKEILNRDLDINLDHLSGFVGTQLKNKSYRFGVFNLDHLLTNLNTSLGYSKQKLEVFYSGLIVGRHNVLSLEDCLLKTQNERRYMYRPILKYKIDGVDYWMCGANKWTESFTHLATNCFPFGQFPTEWKKFPELDTFIKRTMNTHDKILEDPAIEIIKKANLKFDRNVTYLRKPNNRNTSLVKANLGEIDLVFIDEQEHIIYLAECKHNRSRYEYHNWRRDIENFRSTYETQLNNKYSWIRTNKLSLLEHFEILYSCSIANKEQYKVVPMFIINAPTLYMYDSDYLTVTLYDLDLYLQGRHVTIEFNGQLKGKPISFLPPYFKNTEKLFI